MSQPPEWPAKIAELIADQVRHYRKRRNMSIQQLSNEVGRLGVPIERPVLSNLENGRRRTISVAELFIIAAALRVPPLLLLFPLGRLKEMEPLPGTTVSPWAALCWAEHGRIVGVEEPFIEDAVTIAEFRRHEQFEGMWEQSRHEARRLRELLAKPGEELERQGEDVAELRLELADRERLEERAAIMLGQVRRTLRRADLTPPELPRSLRFVDEDDAQ